MENQNRPKGLSMFGVMTTVFIALKLAKVINWSWWLVLSPSIIQFGIILLCLIIVGIDTLIKSTK